MRTLISTILRDAVEVVKKYKAPPQQKPPRRRPAIQNKTDRSDYMKEYLHQYRKEQGKDYQKVPDKIKKYRAEQRKRLKKRLNLKSANKYEALDFVPPKAVAEAASLGLEYRQKAGGKGGLNPSQAAKLGIGSGVQRAINLKNRDKLAPSTVKRMKAFFSRHRKNRTIDPKFKKEPWKDRGWVAWLLWGGDPGDKWSREMVEKMERIKNKMASSIIGQFIE